MDPVDPWYLLAITLIGLGALTWQIMTQGEPLEDEDRVG